MGHADKFEFKAYDHDGVLLNVSGNRDEDECTITRVTAVDSEIDLFDLFPVNTLCLMADRIDAQLSNEAFHSNSGANQDPDNFKPKTRAVAAFITAAPI